MNQAPQRGLFDDVGFLDAESKLHLVADWPDPEKFPLNRPGDSAGRLVEMVGSQDYGTAVRLLLASCGRCGLDCRSSIGAGWPSAKAEVLPSAVFGFDDCVMMRNLPLA
ncbi:MAG: hypothetical protein KDB90_18625 [Planctomycetes bacterium]|nr:hypothetical protein [Planctomycetota bacterium]